MPVISMDHPLHKKLRLIPILIFSLGLLYFVVRSWHWPLIHDMQVMHYVSFLIDRGWKPYVQIGDMNMPGAYLFEGWALHVFGSADSGWRLYEYCLCATLIGSMVSIARRYDWLAGFIAGGAFVLAHAAEGPRNAGQRDEVMTVLLLLSCAFLFEGIRGRRSWLLFFFALAAGMAASIKPSVVPFGPCALLIAWIHLWKVGMRRVGYLLWPVAGFAAATAIVIGFLVRYGAVHAFLFDLLHVLPQYVTLARPSWVLLIRQSMQPHIALFAVLAIVAAFVTRQRQGWEGAVLLLGVLLGLLSYYGQHKGFTQHRYTLQAFVLLWASLQLTLALRAEGAGKWLAAAGFLTVILYLPRPLYWIWTWKPYDYYSQFLEQDLTQLGPERLQHEIQCLDIVDGCLNALYHLKIEQTTGATGDLLYFLPRHDAVVENARESYWKSLQTNPPAVFVMSNWQFGEQDRNFHKVDTWPEFAAFLRSNYTYTIQREFRPDQLPMSHPGMESEYPAYRIYVRKDWQAKHP